MLRHSLFKSQWEKKTLFKCQCKQEVEFMIADQYSMFEHLPEELVPLCVNFSDLILQPLTALLPTLQLLYTRGYFIIFLSQLGICGNSTALIPLLPSGGVLHLPFALVTLLLYLAVIQVSHVETSLWHASQSRIVTSFFCYTAYVVALITL